VAPLSVHIDEVWKLKLTYKYSERLRRFATYAEV
jgi:hypothetical protein